jgi:hypothetical protein
VMVVVVAAAAAVVVVVVVVWWRPHLHRHQWIVPEYIRTLNSTGLEFSQSISSVGLQINKMRHRIHWLLHCWWILDAVMGWCSEWVDAVKPVSKYLVCSYLNQNKLKTHSGGGAPLASNYHPLLLSIPLGNHRPLKDKRTHFGDQCSKWKHGTIWASAALDNSGGNRLCAYKKKSFG